MTSMLASARTELLADHDQQAKEIARWPQNHAAAAD